MRISLLGIREVWRGLTAPIIFPSIKNQIEKGMKNMKTYPVLTRKNTLPIALITLTLFASAFAVIQVYSSNGQGVPSAKTAASWYGLDLTPPVEGVWYEDPYLSTMIKTSEPADLIISVTAETLLVTDVKIKGTGIEEISTSSARVKVCVAVLTDDGWEIAEPGAVVFNYRLMRLKGLLWSPAQFENITELPEQYIEIFEETKSANGFNFVIKNVGSKPVHMVKVLWMVDTLAGFEGGAASAVIGKRTLVVEAVRMVND
jgi:hypothetical protein